MNQLEPTISADFSENCPFLPPGDQGMSYRDLRDLGDDRGCDFYRTALRYAQTLWTRSLPAQAILQLNRAFAAILVGTDPILREWPPPYQALAWMLRQRPFGCFLGNPVRHFQHLATRVRGEHAEVRSWRAWACFHVAEAILPRNECPRDLDQADSEQVVFPRRSQVMDSLERLGWPGEADEFEAALSEH